MRQRLHWVAPTQNQHPEGSPLPPARAGSLPLPARSLMVRPKDSKFVCCQASHCRNSCSLVRVRGRATPPPKDRRPLRTHTHTHTRRQKDKDKQLLRPPTDRPHHHEGKDKGQRRMVDETTTASSFCEALLCQSCLSRLPLPFTVTPFLAETANHTGACKRKVKT